MLKLFQGPFTILFSLALGVTLCPADGVSRVEAETATTAEFQQAVLIQFGTRERPSDIGPLSEAAFLRKLERAQHLGADLVLVEIDSPGGTIDSSLKLAYALRDAHWAKTVAYVPREALSGAAIMALGCDEIVVRRTAHIGDAGPIFIDENFLFRHAPEKIRSDLASKVRALAQHGKRPPALAEAMVDMEVEVFRVTNVATGQVTYMSDAELRALDDPTAWQKGPLLEPSKKDRFLELDGAMAVQVGLANGFAETRADLAERYGVPPDDIVHMESTWVDTFVTILNFWPVTVLLVVAGLVALYLEMAAPGIGVGGLTAGLCFALFFWSRFLGGTAGWLEILLFTAGVIFLLMELFVIPGFGVAGLSGVVLLLTSLVMAGQRWGTVDGVSSRDLTNLLLYLVGASVASVFAIAMLSRYMGGVRLLRQFILEPPAPLAAAAGSLAASEDGGAMRVARVAVGDEGVAESPLRPAGRALFGDQSRDVVTEGPFIERGRPVRIVKLAGTHITVREIGP